MADALREEGMNVALSQVLSEREPYTLESREEEGHTED
jgi:hypothetical protein